MTGDLRSGPVLIGVRSRFLYFTEPAPVRVAGAPVARGAPDGEPLVRWRLAGSNQRFTGMAATAVLGLAVALDAVADLRDHLERHDRDVVATGPGRWSWVLHRPDGSPAAQAAHAYGRRVDCQRSLGLFLALVPTAGEDPTLRLPGSRRPRARRTSPPPLVAAEVPASPPPDDQHPGPDQRPGPDQPPGGRS